MSVENQLKRMEDEVRTLPLEHQVSILLSLQVTMLNALTVPAVHRILEQAHKRVAKVRELLKANPTKSSIPAVSAGEMNLQGMAPTVTTTTPSSIGSTKPVKGEKPIDFQDIK